VSFRPKTNPIGLGKTENYATQILHYFFFYRNALRFTYLNKYNFITCCSAFMLYEISEFEYYTRVYIAYHCHHPKTVVFQRLVLAGQK